jgi:aminopeptidase-like protein
LEPHLYTLPELPDVTPYVTSYYERNWGFCLPHSVYESLPDGEYHAYIDSEFVEGELNYGHAILEGETDREVLLSANVCHPSLANNELSGPLVLTSLYRRLRKWDRREFTYRFVLVPEAIGSLAYLSRYGEHLQESLAGGLVLTCLGGPKGNLSYKRTRKKNSRIDETVEHVNKYQDISFRFREFDPTGGSDERQYCSPGFNLPVGQFARTVYGNYKEYHNSGDTREFMGIDKLVESSEIIEQVLRSLEYNKSYVNTEPYGEPMLSKRNLYPTINQPNSHSGREFVDRVMMMMNYSDGDHSAIEIAERCDCYIGEMKSIIDSLCEANLLE